MSRRDPSARSGTRKLIDFGRLADGLARPGIDTRTWTALARVDVDPDATVWDPVLGWLVDVTFVGGALDGEGPVVCRMGAAGAGAAAGKHDPPRQGALVVVNVIAGDPNVECVIVGYLHDLEHQPATTVNGAEITEAMASRTWIEAFPTEDKETEHQNLRMTGRETAKLLGQQVRLADNEAEQPFVRGDDYADAEAVFLDALSTFLDLALVPVGAFGSVNWGSFQTAAQSLKAAVNTFKNARQQYLSARVRGT